jgi:hypothetical protein
MASTDRPRLWRAKRRGRACLWSAVSVHSECALTHAKVICTHFAHKLTWERSAQGKWEGYGDKKSRHCKKKVYRDEMSEGREGRITPLDVMIERKTEQPEVVEKKLVERPPRRPVYLSVLCFSSSGAFSGQPSCFDSDGSASFGGQREQSAGWVRLETAEGPLETGWGEINGARDKVKELIRAIRCNAHCFGPPTRRELGGLVASAPHCPYNSSIIDLFYCPGGPQDHQQGTQTSIDLLEGIWESKVFPGSKNFTCAIGCESENLTTPFLLPLTSPEPSSLMVGHGARSLAGLRYEGALKRPSMSQSDTGRPGRGGLGAGGRTP